ncbi:MAG: helix-turn-helix transcriptional regulator [Rickettsiales bacterium]|jgi:transcriptional regulator with XRE-family HTH domain|nr:helix-turn-helix transcriptional regulator [Rickettsiales bacterium]
MLTNKQIIARIRSIASAKGIKNDAEIARRAGTTHVMLIDIPNLKTSPRLDTIDKFARALGVSVSDLIYPEQSQKDTEMLEIWNQLNDSEQSEMRGLMSGIILRRKYGLDSDSEHKKTLPKKSAAA